MLIFFQKFGFFFFQKKRGIELQNIPFFISNFHILAKFLTKKNASSKLYILCFLVRIMAFNDVYIFNFNYFVNNY